MFDSSFRLGESLLQLFGMFGLSGEHWIVVGWVSAYFDCLASSLTDQLIAAWPDLSRTVEHRLHKWDAAMAAEYQCSND